MKELDFDKLKQENMDKIMKLEEDNTHLKIKVEQLLEFDNMDKNQHLEKFKPLHNYLF